jgi:hypothetical protein
MPVISRVIVGRALIGLALIVMALWALSFCAVQVKAHDSWISRQGLRNAAGEWLGGWGQPGSFTLKRPPVSVLL